MGKVFTSAGIGRRRVSLRRVSLRGSFRFPRWCAVPALGLLVALGFSCGDSGAGAGAGTAEAFVASYCDLFTPCCAKANLATDGTQCRLLFGAVVPVSKYDKEQGEACLTAARAAAANPNFCSDPSDDAVPACNSVFGASMGTKRPGETCDSDKDCAASAEGKVECESRFVSGAQMRKCQIRVRGKAGDQPCVGEVQGSVTLSNSSTGDIPMKGYLCYNQDGLRCDSTTDACVAFKAIGEACNSSSFGGECVAQAYCDSAQKKCLARKAAGAACGDALFSSQTECAEGAYCSDAKTCVAQTSDGGACTTNKQCKSTDCTNDTCRPSNPDFGLTFICGTK